MGQIKREELDAALGRAINWALNRQPALTSLSQEARFAYQLDHLKQVAQSMAHVLQLQAGYSKANIITTEQQFGNPGHKDDRHDEQAAWPALIYHTSLADENKRLLHPERKVYVRGRIDRVDMVSANEQHYLNVIDYKSSNRKFDLTTAYAGLDLQLLTYLNSLRHHLSEDQEAAIGGALYQQLSMPTYDYQDYLANGQTKLELNKHNFKGLLLNDLNYLAALDTGLDPQGSSSGNLLQVRFSAGRAKNSPVKAKAQTGSLLVGPQELAALLDRNQFLITEATRKIFAGDISLRPYRLDKQTGLEYSDYLDIFTFDNVLDQQKFRDIDKQQAVDWLANLDSKKGNKQ